MAVEGDRPAAGIRALAERVPLYDEFRADPRFAPLVARLKLPS